jgi:hypothetical protein
MTLDLLHAQFRLLESRVAQLEDAVSIYGPPDPRPLVALRMPRAPSLSTRQTTALIYSLLLASIGLYTWAKMRAGGAP